MAETPAVRRQRMTGGGRLATGRRGRMRGTLTGRTGQSRRLSADFRFLSGEDWTWRYQAGYLACRTCNSRAFGELLKQGMCRPWNYGGIVRLWHPLPGQVGPDGQPLRDFTRVRLEVLADGTVEEIEP